MATVELIYDSDCPNVLKARKQLLRAFAKTRLTACWLEWERSDPESPDYVRGYGSPTILVAGKDVAGIAPSDDVSCCRVYAGSSGGMRGTPSVGEIASALRAAGDGGGGQGQIVGGAGWKSSMASMSGVGAAFLPAVFCPACWPVYAGLLSTLGLGFLLKTTYLFPVTALFLMVATASLGFRARARRGYGPFVLGLGASAVILTGKFVLASGIAMYAGIGLLIIASIWNAWPRRAAGVDSSTCPACAPEGQVSLSQKQGAKEVPQ